jgi:hypothetical protein
MLINTDRPEPSGGGGLACSGISDAPKEEQPRAIRFPQLPGVLLRPAIARSTLLDAGLPWAGDPRNNLDLRSMCEAVGAENASANNPGCDCYPGTPV